MAERPRRSGPGCRRRQKQAPGGSYRCGPPSTDAAPAAPVRRGLVDHPSSLRPLRLPPRPRPRRPLPRRQATVSAAPAVRAPPQQPRPGRDRSAQTAGAAAADKPLPPRPRPPASSCGAAQSAPGTSARLPEGRGAAGRGGWGPPAAAGLGLATPPTPQLRLPGLPPKSLQAAAGLFSEPGGVQVLTL